MNYVFSDRMTNVLEKSVFTWKDLVLASESSKKCTPNDFWQISSF